MDGNPISGATVWLQELNGERNSGFEITDSQGRIRTNLKVPYALSISHIGFAAQTDTVNTNGRTTISLMESTSQLEEIVVTGQYQPQSAKNSVYKVRSIGKERLETQNPTSIQEVLSNELNIQFNRDNATGQSGIQLQGMQGQYVKVLIDGVPVSGRSGATNEFDLSQIDVQSIQRIEIIEGPMSVNYGADALAGVINIITKKDVDGRLDLSVTLQTETVGDEYGLFDEGIHSPSVTAGIRINDNWSTQLNGRIYRFGGWQGTGTSRDKQWYPKQQYFGGFLTSFRKENFEAYYRFDLMTETIENKGEVNDLNPLIDPFATDVEYRTKRMFHQFQSDVSLKWATWNSVVSYTDFGRKTHQFESNINTGGTSDESVTNTAFYDSYFTRQTLNQLLSGSWGSLQAGLDAKYDVVSGSNLSEGDKTMTDVGLFVSSEFLLNKLKVRPGIRFTSNSIYETIPTPSINFNFQPNPTTQIRWSYGRGFRAPSLRELYHEFIDSNHNLVGNPNLKPEYSHSVNVDLSKQFPKQGIEASLGGFFNDTDNLITFFTDVNQPNSPTTYVNQLKYKTTGFNARGQYQSDGFTMEVGASYIGQYQRLSEDENIPSLLFFPEITARPKYSFTSAQISIAAFYKFNGKREEYRRNADEEVLLTERQAYHMLDITVTKSIKKNLRLSVGARNVLDVTSVNSTVQGGAHSSSNGSSPIAFGRSYFLTLNYHLSNN